MPRNMSFFTTVEQVRNKTKTVTRRLGWRFLKIEDILNAVEKCQGLKKGEKVKKIWQIRVVDTRIEPLIKITIADVKKEGFPDMDQIDFAAMFIADNKCDLHTEINRIEFEYI